MNLAKFKCLFRMFAANFQHFGTSGFYFVEYLVNGCRYFPYILYWNIIIIDDMHGTSHENCQSKEFHFSIPFSALKYQQNSRGRVD